MTLKELVTTIVSSAGASVVFVGIFVWILREWISDRLKASIQHEYDQKLEAYKAQLKSKNEVALLELKTALEREAALHTAAHASFSEGQKASVERKLNSIDKLWESVVKLRSAIPILMYLVDVMTVEEYSKNAVANRAFQTFQASLSSEVMNMSKLEAGSTENFRPYLGEYTWALYVAYYAIMIRAAVALYLAQAQADPSEIEWYKNDGTRQIIEGVLTQTELEEFDVQAFGKFSWIQRQLESKILSALAKVISGQEFGAESLAQAMRIQQTVAKYKDEPGIQQL